MSVVLFKNTWKRNWLLLAIITAVLALYAATMVLIYNPESMQLLGNMLKVLPRQLLSSMGMATVATDLTGLLASWLYGLLMLAFPTVYGILLSNRLVARMVDNGSFVYLLCTPTTRARIIITQGVYALLTMLAMFLAVFAFSWAFCQAMVPGALDVRAFVRLNTTSMLGNMAMMMISFFCSCAFSESRVSTAFGAGIPIAFLLMNMLGGMAPEAAFLKKLSLIGLYDPVALVGGAASWGVNLLYCALIAALFAGGVLIFRRKQLPL